MNFLRRLKWNCEVSKSNPRKKPFKRQARTADCFYNLCKINYMIIHRAWHRLGRICQTLNWQWIPNISSPKMIDWASNVCDCEYSVLWRKLPQILSVHCCILCCATQKSTGLSIWSWFTQLIAVSTVLSHKFGEYYHTSLDMVWEDVLFVFGLKVQSGAVITWSNVTQYFDGLVQERRNSNANPPE